MILIRISSTIHLAISLAVTVAAASTSVGDLATSHFTTNSWGTHTWRTSYGATIVATQSTSPVGTSIGIESVVVEVQVTVSTTIVQVYVWPVIKEVMAIINSIDGEEPRVSPP